MGAGARVSTKGKGGGRRRGARRDRGGQRREGRWTPGPGWSPAGSLLVRKAVGSKVVCTSLKGAMSKITFEKKGKVDYVFGFILAF